MSTGQGGNQRGGQSSTIINNFYGPTSRVEKAENVTCSVNHGAIHQTSSQTRSRERSHISASKVSAIITYLTALLKANDIQVEEIRERNPVVQGRFSLLDLLQAYLPLLFASNQGYDLPAEPKAGADAPGDSVVDPTDSGVEIKSMDEYSSPPRSHPSGPAPYEVYVHTMLESREGLPCWEPQPHEPEIHHRGVMPGDIGIYTASDGFQWIFNLWDAMDNIRDISQTIGLPDESQNLVQKNRHIFDKLRTGRTLVGGGVRVVGKSNEFFEFNCAPISGAVLAVLCSPADKHVANDLPGMEKYIRRHAEAIYRHATDKLERPLGEKESLYIITGCIKCESWAIAAYNGHIDSTLRLVLNTSEWDRQPFPGAHSGRSHEDGLKNQTLFFEGFKLAFSSSFRSRVEGGHPSLDDPNEGGSRDGGVDEGHDQTKPSSHGPHSSGTDTGGQSGNSTESAQLRSQTSTLSVAPNDSTPARIDDDVDISRFPESPAQAPYHPSDVINAYLLRQTGCDIAITHDDTWRALLKRSTSDLGADSSQQGRMSPEVGESGINDICVQNGVAFILPVGASTRRDTPSVGSVSSPHITGLHRPGTAQKTSSPPKTAMHEVFHSPVSKGALNALPRGDGLQRPAESEVQVTRLYQNIAIGAIHNSVERREAPKCHKQTRVTIRQDMFSWVEDGDRGGGRRLLWLSGPAGIGKSAIMGTIADEFQRLGQLAASFFFSVSSASPKRWSKRCFVTTLAYQLQQQSTLKGAISPILSSITADPAVFEKSLAEQAEVLILSPLRVSRGTYDIAKVPKVILIDGLDECDESFEPTGAHPSTAPRSKGDNQTEILTVLLQILDDPAFPFQIILASRLEPWIQRFFATPAAASRTTWKFLHNHCDTDKDITVFLRSGFMELRRRYDVPKMWPGERVIAKLVKIASGHFSYAAAVMRFIETPSSTPPLLLDIVFDLRPEDPENPFGQLDALYTRALMLSTKPRLAFIWLRAYQIIRSALDVEISAWFFNYLCQSSTEEEQLVLGELSSLVQFPNSLEGGYTFYHESFLEFLGDPRRCQAFAEVSVDSVLQWICERFGRVLVRRGPEVPMDASLAPSFANQFFELWYFYTRAPGCLMTIPEDLLSKCDPAACIKMSRGSSEYGVEFQRDMFVLVHQKCDSSSTCRPVCEAWRSATAMSLDNPIWGSGTGSLDMNRFSIRRLRGETRR